MTRARFAWTSIAIVIATAGALLQQAAQPAPSASTTALLPGGAALVLHAKDLASLVSDWNGSVEKAAWLRSSNYEAFSRSRLFLRLTDAYDEFATAAGIPPDMALLSEVAGGDSALGVYDIGKLEFLYVTRMPAAKAIENALWRTRGSYEPREAAGTPFYVRTDPESHRAVAFAARDQVLVLGTRGDLVAGALALIGASAPAGAAATVSVERDAWFTRAVAAAGAAGDVRLVANLEKLVKEPHFRSYWIQQNITELKEYVAAVSDIVRTRSDVREQRILLRASELAPQSGSVGEALNLVPDNAGLYRAWASPAGPDASRLVFEKTMAASGASAAPNRVAPLAGAASTTTGAAADLETRIDEEVRPAVVTYDLAALDRTIGAAPLTSMLHVESTRPGADGVFVDRGAVVVLARQSDWPEVALRGAAAATVDAVWTKAHIGMQWTDRTIGGQTFAEISGGVDPFAIAVRGRFAFFSNDPALLVSVLATTGNPAAVVTGSYAAGFRHALERERFRGLMRLVDHQYALAERHPALFFSENVASLSDTLSRIESASIVVRNEPVVVRQTVTYHIGR